MMQDQYDSSEKMNSLKQENMALQEQVQNMKKVLESRFEDEQKEQTWRTMMSNINKMKSLKDYTPYMNRMKGELFQLLNDYVALKQFNQSKSEQIMEQQQQIDKQQTIISVLDKNGVQDVDQFIQNYGSIKQQNDGLQSQLKQQMEITNDLNTKNDEFIQANQSLAQAVTKQQDQLQDGHRVSKEEIKKQVRQMMDINGLEDQQQKEQALKQYLQNNGQIVQEIYQDIEEEKRQEEARQLAIKKAEEAKKKKGRYGNNRNATKNRYQSANNLQKRPMSQKVNNKQTVKTSYNKMPQYNKYSEKKMNNNRIINSSYSQKQVSKKNGVKELPTEKKEDKEHKNIFVCSVSEMMTNNNEPVSSQYMSQPVPVEQAKVNNDDQKLQEMKRNIVLSIVMADITELKAVKSPPACVKEIFEKLQYVVDGQSSSSYAELKTRVLSKQFIQKVMEYDVDSLNGDQYKQLNELINVKQITQKRAEQVSKAVASFYKWLHGVYCYYKTKNRL